MICKTSTQRAWQRAQTSANVVQCSPIAHSPDLESIMIGSRSPTNVFVLLRAGCVCDNLLDHMYNTYLKCTEECLRVQAADTAMIVYCFFFLHQTIQLQTSINICQNSFKLCNWHCLVLTWLLGGGN